MTYVDAKRTFTERHLDDLNQRFLDVIDIHPILRALPKRDRVNAAAVAALHALLAIRAASVSPLL